MVSVLLQEKDPAGEAPSGEPVVPGNRRQAGFDAEDVEAFDRRGFALIPRLLEREALRIDLGFEEAMAPGHWSVVGCENYDASATRCESFPRMASLSILDRSRHLQWLRGDPRITSIATAVLGADATFQGAEGNLFNGDTLWHNDEFWTFGAGRHLKFMLYLDPLRATSGALRVVEGSHRDGARRDALEDGARPNSRCPVRTLEVTPGDLVVFDFRVFHASFGGGVGRRVLSMDFGPSASRLGEAKRLFLENATRHPSPDEYATLGRTPTARARASG